MTFLIFIIILLVLILVHEFGHFYVAKKFGIRVDEFGFGFPPRIARLWKKNGTEYTINAIPFGGFVKIFGENPTDIPMNETDRKQSFLGKPRLVQAAVLFAGVFFNLIFAWFILTVGFLSGMPTSSSSGDTTAFSTLPQVTIVSVHPDSPASRAGLMPGDKVISLETSDTALSKDLDPKVITEFVSHHDGDKISLVYERKGEETAVTVTPEKIAGSDAHIIGISMDTIGIVRLPIHKAIWEGFHTTVVGFWGTLTGFIHLIGGAFSGSVSAGAVAGPVGIAGLAGDAYQFGFGYMLFFVAILSINLAVINLIPFPALDGGRLLFLLIEKIKGSPIKPQISNIVNGIGFLILIGFMLVVTYHDIVRLF